MLPSSPQRVTYLAESLHLYMLGCRLVFIVIIHHLEEVKTLLLTLSTCLHSQLLDNNSSHHAGCRTLSVMKLSLLVSNFS